MKENIDIVLHHIKGYVCRKFFDDNLEDKKFSFLFHKEKYVLSFHDLTWVLLSRILAYHFDFSKMEKEDMEYMTYLTNKNFHEVVADVSLRMEKILNDVEMVK